jgi:ComF family protein
MGQGGSGLDFLTFYRMNVPLFSFCDALKLDDMHAWTETILDALLPRHCILCGLGSGSRNICPPCSEELPHVEQPCSGCGLPITSTDSSHCERCINYPFPWDSAITALPYAFPVDQLVRRFKFSRSLAAGQVLAERLTRAVVASGKQLPDAIIPVPLHRSRLVSRTFNQSEILARYAAGALQIPLYPTALRRTRKTRAHSGLDAVSRRININAAFTFALPAKKHEELQHAALVDDVLTTGATLAECTGVLKSAGIQRISVWVVARAPAPGNQAV